MQPKLPEQRESLEDLEESKGGSSKAGGGGGLRQCRKAKSVTLPRPLQTGLLGLYIVGRHIIVKC